jgi:glutaminase
MRTAQQTIENADPDELTQDLLDGVAQQARAVVDDRGEPFALATCDLAGDELAVGDADTTFPIQSISKVFSLTLALRVAGEDLFDRVGREPSGDPYNSLVQLERERGVPRNPMINAGALVVCDLLLGRCADPRAELLQLLHDLTGEELERDQDLLQGEGRTGERNLASAHLMSAFGNLRRPADEVMDVYLHQCAVRMSARQLARAIRFLAHDGLDPGSGRRVVSEAVARRVNALMLTCGTYDSAGQFAYEVGLPCKSGVAGAIVGNAPGRLGVCAWSPPLDETGNSRAGRVALHLLAERAGLSVF